MVFGLGHAPLGWRVGFLHAPFDAVLEATRAWNQYLQLVVHETPLVASFPDALLGLAPLQTPPTREIVARTKGDAWTAHFANNHLGGDSASWCGYLSGVLGCESVEASHIPVGQYPYPSTTFSLTSPRATGPLRSLRSIHAGKYDSGRWEHRAHGEVQPFEETERYGARKIRDRFDRPMLVRYLAALGIAVDDPAFWTGGVLLQREFAFRPRTTSLEDFRREYGIDG